MHWYLSNPLPIILPELVFEFNAGYWSLSTAVLTLELSEFCNSICSCVAKLSAKRLELIKLIRTKAMRLYMNAPLF